MLNDVQHKLEKSWVFGFQNLRIANHSENDGDEPTVYALDFTGKPDDTEISFITTFGQMVGRINSKFHIIGACLEFDNIPFAIIEFREKE